MVTPTAFNWIGGGFPASGLFTPGQQPPQAWDWITNPQGPPQQSPWAGFQFGGGAGQPISQPPQRAPVAWRGGTPILDTFNGPVGQNYWDGNRFVPAMPAPVPGQTPTPMPTDGGGNQNQPPQGAGGGGYQGAPQDPQTYHDIGGNPPAGQQQTATGNQTPLGGGGFLGGLLGGGFSPGVSPAFGAQGWGAGLGLVGSAAGLGLGVPGLGVLGGALGTGIDISNANRGLQGAWLGDPALAPSPLGFGAYANGLLHGASFGLLGQSIEQSATDAYNRAFDLQPDVQNNRLGSPTRSIESGLLGPSPGGLGWGAFVEAVNRSIDANPGLFGVGPAQSGVPGAGSPSGRMGGGTDEGGWASGPNPGGWDGNGRMGGGAQDIGGWGADPNPGGLDNGGWGDNAAPGGGGWADGGLYAKGGVVTQGHVPGDPPGPDNVMIGAQTGEGVVTRNAMAKYPGLLGAMNRGDLDPNAVRGLLGAKQLRDAPESPSQDIPPSTRAGSDPRLGGRFRDAGTEATLEVLRRARAAVGAFRDAAPAPGMMAPRGWMFGMGAGQQYGFGPGQ